MIGHGRFCPKRQTSLSYRAYLSPALTRTKDISSVFPMSPFSSSHGPVVCCVLLCYLLINLFISESRTLELKSESRRYIINGTYCAPGSTEPGQSRSPAPSKRKRCCCVLKLRAEHPITFDLICRLFSHLICNRQQAMFGKISSAISSFTNGSLPPGHHAPEREKANAALAQKLAEADVPVSESDCVSCGLPCPAGAGIESGAGTVVEAYSGKPYEEYVEEKYGEIEGLPKGFEQDWETDLAGSAKGGKGRVVVISTGKSDWERDHTVSLFFQFDSWPRLLLGLEFGLQLHCGRVCRPLDLSARSGKGYTWLKSTDFMSQFKLDNE